MKKDQYEQYIYEWLDRILSWIPDWVTGDTLKLMQKYVTRYGNINLHHRIHQRKRKTLAAYLVVLMLFILVSATLIISQANNDSRLSTIKRPEYGQATKSLPLRVRMNYENLELEKPVHLKLRAGPPSQAEKKAKVDQLKAQLESIIPGDNPNLQQITKPLNLIEFHGESGATISWSSANGEVLKENGEVDLILAEPGESIMLEAMITLDGYVEPWGTLVTIGESILPEDYERTLEKRLDENIKEISRSKSPGPLILPDKMGSQINLEWYMQNESTLLPFLIAFCFAIVIIYLNRYQQIDKEIKDRNHAIICQLPDFMNQLVLLLNAGLVVSTAISKIAEDYEGTIAKSNAGEVGNGKQQDRRILYEELVAIHKKVKQTNVPLIYELRDFSKRSGISELIRVSNIIGDNLNKGSSLAEKLQAESEFLWLSRKKKAEEQGKLAETKLTFPLVILLIVLIMITIAPALMDM